MRKFRYFALALALVWLAFYVDDCRADQVVCTSDGVATDTCDVILPNVLAHWTPYPTVQFLPGDTGATGSTGSQGVPGPACAPGMRATAG